MNTSRRVFLKQGAMALVAAGVAPVFGPAFLRQTVFADEPRRSGNATGGRKTLICIFQRGAVDGLSMVVPHGDPFYYQHRKIEDGGIAIARTGDMGVIDIDGTFGFNPNLKPFKALYDAGHLAAIQAVGSPSTTRSHFDAQDFMEAAIIDHGSNNGWLARTLMHCPEDAANRAKQPSTFRGVSLTGQVPRSFMGFPGALAIPDLGNFDVKGNMMMSAADTSGGFEALYDQAVGDVMHGTGKETFEALKQLRDITSKPYVAENNAVYPRSKFAESLKQIAQLIKANVGVEIAFAETGGWDTHNNQGGAQGQLARNLADFSQSLAALYADLGDRMADVTILTMSEFGRTVHQNGTNGTDHGHATCFFVLGGNVNGGKVYGDWPGLAPEQLNESRDLKVTTDFRNVFAEVAQKQMGVKDLPAVFPEFNTQPNNFRNVLKT